MQTREIKYNVVNKHLTIYMKLSKTINRQIFGGTKTKKIFKRHRTRLSTAVTLFGGNYRRKYSKLSGYDDYLYKLKLF